MDDDIGKNLAVFAGKAVIVGFVVFVLTLAVWPSISHYEKCKADTDGSVGAFNYCLKHTSW